jgi:hypothetical protein
MNAFHFHTPKTGGTFLKYKLRKPLEQFCKLKFVNVKAHDSWELATNDVYVFSSFREPIKRLVSSYCHFRDAMLEPDPTVKGLMNWYEENSDILINYQAKNFLIDEVFNEKLIIENIKKVNLLIRDNQFNDEKLERIKLQIISDLNLSNGFYVKDISNVFNSRSASHKLYAELPETIKKQIRQDNALDCEVYLNNSLYWNNGQ